MKPLYIFSFCLAAMAAPLSAPAAVQTEEPASSVMASGKWVKIRVNADGVYELSHKRLRELGFSEPEKVNVFGYRPTLLLTHDESLIPADLSPMQAVHKSGKLLFYAKGNVDMEKEVWSESTGTGEVTHSIHSHSTGATYFLSDAASVSTPEITMTEAPAHASLESALTYHEAMIYHEKEAVNYAEGGFWFAGEAINRNRPEETHRLEVRKATRGGSARLFYTCLMSPTSGGSNYKNYLQALCDGGIEYGTSTGTQASVFSDPHQFFSRAVRRQGLKLPESAADRLDFTVTFSLHPQASAQSGDCALDYFALTYERNNDLTDEAQMQMYFLNKSVEADFALSGMEGNMWSVWDVTDPGEIREFGLTDVDGQKVGHLGAATMERPNVVVAFRADADQPEPEIIGSVPSQNLHAMKTPDLVVLTSAMMMSAAEKAAAFHREHQGIEVEVVDQQDVFNEYGSGNVSPEAIRRFMAHLYSKDSSKLKALLIVGPATYNNATLVNEDSPYVVSAETEDYVSCQIGTTNSCIDAFYGHLGQRCVVDLWGVRCGMYQIIGSGMNIGVGRLPYKSDADFDAYYKKAESYLTYGHNLPLAGQLILASDYADRSIDQHMANAEALATTLGEKAGTTVTITRAASNLYSKTDNSFNRKVMMSAIERGALMFAYFGHGGSSQIGGSNDHMDYLVHLNDVPGFNHAGRFPLIYLGSCSTAPFDKNISDCLSSVLAKSEAGGGIAVIASGREVYQEPNMLLGKAVANAMYGAAQGEWLGTAWAEALTAAVTPSRESKNRICNHLTYNFIGDPALPVFSASCAVNISDINGQEAGALIADGNNTVKGSVTDSEGNVLSSFNGTVVLTVFDVPQTLKNIAPGGSSTHSTFIPEVTADHEIIGEYRGEVINGQFSVSFIGPNSARSGSHRVRAYAFSADGDERGIGCATELAIEQAPEDATRPEAPAVSIAEFRAGSGRADAIFDGRATLTAVIDAPAGIAASTAMTNPVRLTIDGVAYTNASRLLNAVETGRYELNYSLGTLSMGRHMATLSVMDALGNWDEATIEFVSSNVPAAQLSASVADGGVVSFDLTSEIESADVDSCSLIIENLLGEPVRVDTNATFPCEVELPAGAYRAFVQMGGATRLASTGKVELLID